MKRIWYHCSNNDHGPVWECRPRLPNPLRYPDSELDRVRRLCVCPTIAGCFAAILFDRGRDVHVYRTATERGGVKAKVWDQAITRERWIVDPVKLVRLEVIAGSVSDLVNDPIRYYHAKTKKNSAPRLRIAQLAHAVKVLGEDRSSPGDLRWLKRVMEAFAIGEPEEYIFDMAAKHCKEERACAVNEGEIF